MSLSNYLGKAANSHAREELFNYRLLFDVKMAAAQHNYHLQTYYSDVDHDGFDIIFDDHHTIRKVQLKTIMVRSKTSSWAIHRSILRPEHNNWEPLGFFHNGMAYKTECGVEGGVILMEIDAEKPDLLVTYYYTDIYVITAIALGHLNRNSKTVVAAKTLRTDLPSGKLTDKIDVAKNLFIKAAAPTNLLALLSLQSPSRTNWQNRVVLSGQRDHHWGTRPELLATELNQQISEIPDKIEEACGHNDP